MLISWLCQDPELRFFPDIKFADKFPVLDGCIMLGRMGSDRKIHSAGLVEVQVKSTTQSIDNDNKSGVQSVCKFDCPVSILSASLAKVSRNPIVLIVVDIVNSRMYRKILSRKYVESLAPQGKTTKTIYFNRDDELTDHTRFFNELADEDKDTEANYDLALNHHLVCPDDISAEKLEELDHEAARLNQLCDTKYHFLKRWSFENVWKIGLLYSEDDDKYTLALVAMRRGDGNYIALRSLTTARDVSYLKNFPLGPGVNDDAHFAVTFDKNRPFSEAIDKLLIIWCKAFTETWFVPPEAMSDDVICEVAYYYLDHLAQWIPQFRAEEHPTRFAGDTKTDYIANYKKFVSTVGSSRELAARVFFGEHGASSAPRYKRECTLYINEHQAQFKALEYANDIEEWVYCATEPYEDFKPYSNDELKRAYEKHGAVTGYNTDPPTFVSRLPLLGAIEDFLLEGAKRLISEDAVRRHAFPDEPKRKEHMSYTVSYDPSPAQDEWG